jgi:cytochrome c oxidase cbb3-type subunit 2
MTFKAFAIALMVSFGLPWLMIVVVPFAKMRTVEPVNFTEEDDGKDEVYVPRRAGRIADGAAVYSANGCYVCHTQLIRPSFAGSELGRPGWAGFIGKTDEGISYDTRRETTPYDFVGESFAQIGIMRVGPDLSNVGGRIERYVKEDDAAASTPENWLFLHLYDARKKVKTYRSKCPSQPHLFVERDVHGQGSPDAIAGLGAPGREILPTDKALALVSYLLSMKKDDPVPYSINYSRDKKKAE